ncbi:MAG: S8 family serine peptidase [Pseudomonadota bacterium]
MVNTRRFYRLVLLTLLTSILPACGGGGSGGDKNPPVTSTKSIATSQASASSAPAKSTDPEIPVFETTLTLGAPTSNPIVIPPSPTGVPVKFLAVVRGTFYPEQLAMDEVDKSGAIVQANVLQLKDDGVDSDAFRGDRTYSGQLILNSVFSAEKMYRVHASHKGAEVTSGTGRFWVSGCPSVARPSNPARAVLDTQSGAYVFANEMLVTLADSVPPDLGEINAIMSDVQGQVVGCIPALRQYLVEIAGSTTSNALYSAISTLKNNANVVDATPNALVLNMPESGKVACDGLECQWYLDRIRAPQAWSLVGGGDEQASVAVIDFGVNCNNPELNCNSSIVSEDTIDHGTGVASLIGARKGDGTAMVGVAWNTELYPFSFIGSGGSQYKMSELITLSMARESIRVINISAATATDPGNQIRNAMCSAIDSGRLIIAAAGNASTANNCQLASVYPAFYNGVGQCANGANLAKGLLVVGATDADNNLAQWEDNSLCSNTLYVDIFAPGKDIYAANATSGGYSAKNGTSFAAPLVAGSAAVLWAAQPTLTVAGIHDKLVASAATFSQTATAVRSKTMDARLEGKQLIDLYAAVGGKDSQVNPDVTPEVFTIPENNQADRNAEVKSAPIIVTGIDATVPIDISGGFYSIDNGPFTSAAGTVGPNQSVVVLLHSADSALANTEATLTIGTISKTFQVTTVVAAAPQPDNFDFYDVIQAQPSASVTSNILRIAGITAATTIAVTSGEYAIDGGAFTSASGTVGPNQDIQIRTTAASTPATTVTTVVTIGGVSDNFNVITRSVDTNPEPFIFTGLTNVSPGIQVESNTITLAGINSAALISISGGEYAIDGGSFSATASTIVAGQTVKVRHRSATAFASDSYSTLTIGGYSATFHSVTLGNTAPVATAVNILDSNGDTAEVGDNLTGSYTYADADLDPQGATSFRWLRNGAAISGATSVNYTLVVSDTGKDIRFEVTPRATTGVLLGTAKLSTAITTTNSAPRASNIIVTDTNGTPLITGDTLSVSYSYQDADNDLQGISSYRWLRSGTAISGATSASYRVTSTDVGQMLTVEITPVALTGKLTGTAVVSNAILLGNTAPQVTGVSISGATAGKSVVGANLTGTYNFSDVDGDLEGSSSYRWFRNGTAISGATSVTYSVTAADSGQLLAFEVSPIALTGTVQGLNVRSGNVAINAIPVAQLATIVDSNGGSLVVGDSLTGSYTYFDSDSDAQGVSKYRWLRNGAAISGATSATYVLTGADSGQSIVFEVTPVASTGSLSGIAVKSAALTTSNSAPVAANVALVDTNGGTATLGDVLNGTYSYSDSDGDSQGATTFRWLRNGTTVISSSQSYTLTAADSGQNIQFRVTPRASSGVVLGTEVASTSLAVLSYVPNAFAFTAATNAALNTTIISNTITISGINTAAPVSISGGQYSVSGGAYTSAAGSVTNGQTVTVRLTSSATSNTATQAVLTIGGVTSVFSVTTLVADTTPDTFTFTAVTNAAVSTAITSNAITISGINSPAAISISGGQYSINGGTFTSTAGTVSNGQIVTVRVTSSASANTATQATLSIGGATGTFSVTTAVAPDTTPDVFTFAAVSNATVGTVVISSPITVSGINTAASISIAGGEYSINGGTYTSTAGTVSNGQTVTIRLTSSAITNTTVQAVLTISGIAATFSVTTVLPDTTPDTFSFTAATNSPLNTAVTSNAITVSGINTATSISITGGQYSIAGGAYISTSGTVTNGQTVTVKVTASGIPDSTTQAVLTIGGVTATFSATTVVADTVPNTFSFTAVTSAALNSSVTSTAITVSGINAAASISITNGQYSIAGGAFTSATGTVTNGQTVIVRVTASATPNTATLAVLTISGIAGTFSATTLLTDTTPDIFSFAPVINAKANILITSATITVTGINGPATITITGGEYAIESGAFTNVNGTVTNAQSVKVRLTSMAGSNAATAATLTIGGVSTAFSVTTLTDTTAPTAQIIFPAATSITNDLAVLVRGTAADNANNIASVKVNGLLATTGDGFATWQVSVPLVQGANNLAVDVKDAANNTALNAATASITNNFIMRTLASIAIDSLRNRALVLDNVLKAVIAVDLTSGARTVLSNSSTPSSANSFSIPLGMELDAANNRALVVDDGLDAVVAVDLVSGARTILSNASTPSSVNGFSAPVDITLDAARNRALVIDNGLNALLAVDLTSGARTMLSTNSTPSNANKFSAPRGVTLDTANNRALVVDYLLDTVFAVDLTSGARTILSNASTPSSANSFIYPVNITLDPTRNRALVADYDLKAVVAVDLTSGARTILSNVSTPSSANGFSHPGSIKLDVVNNRALVADVNPPSVIAVDLNSGARTILSN